MRTNALEYMNADADESGELDFAEFCQLVRELEEGEHSAAELRARFDELDTNRNGTPWPTTQRLPPASRRPSVCRRPSVPPALNASQA